MDGRIGKSALFLSTVRVGVEVGDLSPLGALSSSACASVMVSSMGRETEPVPVPAPGPGVGVGLDIGSALGIAAGSRLEPLVKLDDDDDDDNIRRDDDDAAAADKLLLPPPPLPPLDAP